MTESISSQEIESLIEQAHSARRQGDHAAALAAFETVVAVDPTQSGLKASVASELRELGRLDEAEALLRQALAIEPQHVTLLAELGYTARQRGDRTAALSAFKAAVVADPTHVGLKASAAAELRELARLDEAEALLRQALAIDPQHAGSLAEFGYIARSRGDHAAALAAFEAAVAADPTHVGLKASAASELRELERFDEAEALLRQVLAIEPQHVPSLAELGYIARSRGDRAAALAAFEAAAAADPTHVGLKAAAAAQLRELGRLDEAETLLRQVLAMEPQHVPSLAEIGYIARSRGDHAVALAAFQAATAADPLHVGLKASAAAELRELGHLDEAEASLRQILAIEPRHVPSLAELGYVARGRGDRAGALAAFEAAAAADPTHLGLKVAAAAQLRELGRLDEAEALLRLALAIDPQHLPSLIGLGHLARQRGDCSAALAAFEAAAAVNLSEIGPALEIANCLRDLGQIGMAESRFQKILAADPRNAIALIGLGSIRLDQFRLEESEQMFRRAAAVAPNEPARLLGIGYLARRRGDQLEALSHFSAAWEANPSHAGAAFETAAALRELGRFSAARDIIDGLLRLNPRDHAAIMQLGYLYRREGKRQLALEQFTIASQEQPQQPQPLVEMSIELRAKGQPQGSVALLRSALAIYPDHQAALDQLAEHHLLAEEFDEALTVARRAVAVYPHRTNSYLLASRAATELGQGEEVVHLLDQADELVGPHPEIRSVRANFHMLQRDWDAAYKLLLDPQAQTQHHACLWTLLVRLAITTGAYDAAEAAMPARPLAVYDVARVHLFQGQIAEARWDLEQAAKNYRQAVSLEPGDANAHFELARVSLKLLDLEACRHYLGRLVDLTAASLRLRGQSLNMSQTHVGQILDEFALDAHQLDALRHIRSLPVEEQIAPLQKMVASNPDYTPAAIMLLAAMRQAGLLVRQAVRSPNGVLERIPRRIVQYWDEIEPPPEIAKLMETWRQAHPDFEYVRLNDQIAQQFLVAHGLRDVLMAYRRAREPAQKADLIRLAFLATEGGVYTDADDRCIAAVGTFVPPDASFVSYQEDYGTLGNNFLAVAPNHPVISLALKLAAAAVNRGDNDLLWLSTGPGVLSRAFAQIVSDPERNMSEGLEATILDLGFIARSVGFHCPVLYKKTTRHWSRSRFGGGKRTNLKKQDPALSDMAILPH